MSPSEGRHGISEKERREGGRAGLSSEGIGKEDREPADGEEERRGEIGRAHV